jgi:beta-phosphoglucomutase
VSILSIEAVIFDLDGVITDTAEVHYRAWQRLADELGIEFDRSMNESFRGVSRSDCLEILLEGRSYDNVEELLERKNSYYLEGLDCLSPDDVVPAVVDLLHELTHAGIKTAIGSASKNTMAVLAALEILDLFDAVVDGTMVVNSKPDPEVFLMASTMLGVVPEACLVVEDSAAGIDAALAGNMWVLGIGPQERVGHAHAVIPSLAHQSWQTLSPLIEVSTR